MAGLRSRARLFTEILLVIATVWLLHGNMAEDRSKKRPAGTVSVPRSVVCEARVSEKVVALTYDDGPHPVFTPEILRILEREHVRATFFLIGRAVEAHPEIVRDIVRRGHAIGNHTYTHPHNLEADTPGQIAMELDRCENALARVAGRRPFLFRPPRGLIDGTILRIARKKGYRVILWTVCADHHDAPTARQMADRVLAHSRPGAILLVHDGQTGIRWKDVSATGILIRELKNRGYRFVTVPQLLAIEQGSEVTEGSYGSQGTPRPRTLSTLRTIRTLSHLLCVAVVQKPVNAAFRTHSTANPSISNASTERRSARPPRAVTVTPIESPRIG